MLKFYKNCRFQGLAQFSTAIAEAPFAAELLRQLTDTGNYQNIDELVEDLAEGFQNRGFNFDDEDVLGLLTGEILPSQETLEALADLYNENSEEDVSDYVRLVEAAKASYDTLEEPEYEEDESEYEPEEASEEYEEEEDEDPTDILEEQYSRVALMEQKQAVNEALGELMQYASSLVEEGKLPPVAFRAMFGEGTPRFAEFSSVSQERGLDNAEHLEAIRYSLDLFSACGELMMFSQQVDFEDPEELAQEDAIQSIAEGSFRLYRQDNPFE